MLEVSVAFTRKRLKKYDKKLKRELKDLKAAAKNGYEDDRASINLPLDKDHLEAVRKLARQHKNLKLLVVVGIGGSNLGTIAVQEALLGKHHNLAGEWPLVLYADTVDPHRIRRINDVLEQSFKRKHDTLVYVVSKSGGTAETIANFEILLRTVRKHTDPEKHVVACSNEGSNLWQLAEEEGFPVLPIPEKVGGRYSVFSPVSLFPLALLGIDVKKLLQGAAKMRKKCLKARGNPAMQRAAMLKHAHEKGRNIADNFYFKTDFESIGKWYRQLMGESIGKEKDRQGRQVWRGLTPTVSIGTTDLHSMAQLYFGGPQDKIHTIVTIKDWKDALAVPGWKRFSKLVPNIQKKRLTTIMDAVVQGVTAVLKKQERPYGTITLPRADEESIGALLQLHMMEMMFLGRLMNVNPFDQPNVEAYKTETKKVLG